VIRELEQRKIEFKIITSGQTSVNFNEVSSWIKKTKPDIVLPQKVNQSSVFLFLTWAIRTLFKAPFLLSREFEKINKSSSFFIVHGDTVSSLIGAIVVRFFGLKVVHIESGLRSFNFLEPFPEEITRFVISRLADIHFCPNKWSLNNLRSVNGQKINTFQNTFLESYVLARNKLGEPGRRKTVKGKYCVFVLHRQEHVIFQRGRSKKLVKSVVRNIPANIKCVFIRHVTNLGLFESIKNGVFLPRLPYVDFIRLLEGAEFLVTDGGGNQEEAYYMGLPCLLLREHTERIEGLGENVVLSKNNRKVIKSFFENYKIYERKRVNIKERPSKIIVDYLWNTRKSA